MNDFDLLNQVPCGYLALSETGSITIANDMLHSLLGYANGELLGKNIEEIFTLATKVFYSTHLFPTLKLQHRADEIFISLKTKENESLPVLTNAVFRKELDAVSMHFVFIAIRQRQKHEDAILRAKAEAEKMLKENAYLEKLKTSLETKTLELDKQYNKLLNLNENLLQFSKIVSHDLQEPLRKIQIFGDMLAADHHGPLDDKSLAAISKINRQADRMRQLTLGLHQYVTLDSENLVTTVDLSAAANQAYNKVVDKRQISDVLFRCGALPSIDGYSAQLDLLFVNLIDNAFQFRDSSRQLIISITATFVEENEYKVSNDKYRFTKHLRLVFADNGSGFDKNYKEHVFELLTKLDPSMGGLGIGLSIIKKVVLNHSGEIKVESRQGYGTTFIILLPVKAH